MIEPSPQFDALIIGGGVIGCAIAWRLGQAGMRVAVIERGEIGREASYAAGGMLAPLAEADRADDFFHLCVTSRAMYADFARELRAASGIDIEYRTEGTLYLSLTEADDEELGRRWQWQREAGLHVKRLQAGCARKLEPLINEKLRWALLFPDDHQVNNRHLAQALARAAQNAGATLLTYTEARRLLIENRAGQMRVTGVETTRGSLRAGAVAIAAGSWSSLLSPMAERPGFIVEPVRGQMIAVEMPAPAVRHVIYSRRGYLIPRASGFLIAGSTTERAGYDKRTTAGGIASIVARATEMLPGFGELAITETWAGLRPHVADDLPVLGVDPQITGLLYATGHYRNGILLCPVTAQAISDLIIKGASSINLAPFSAARFARRQAAHLSA